MSIGSAIEKVGSYLTPYSLGYFLRLGKKLEEKSAENSVEKAAEKMKELVKDGKEKGNELGWIKDVRVGRNLLGTPRLEVIADRPSFPRGQVARDALDRRYLIYKNGDFSSLCEAGNPVLGPVQRKMERDFALCVNIDETLSSRSFSVE